MSILMIPLKFLYDEYIDWPKFSEQKNPFEYIVPPPTSGIGTINSKTSSQLFFLWLSFQIAGSVFKRGISKVSSLLVQILK